MEEVFGLAIFMFPIEEDFSDAADNTAVALDLVLMNHEEIPSGEGAGEILTGVQVIATSSIKGDVVDPAECPTETVTHDVTWTSLAEDEGSTHAPGDCYRKDITFEFSVATLELVAGSVIRFEVGVKKDTDYTPSVRILGARFRYKTKKPHVRIADSLVIATTI